MLKETKCSNFSLKTTILKLL